MKKRITVLGLLLFMLFCITSIANATIMDSQYISDCRAGVYSYSGGTVEVQFSILAPNTMDKLGAKTIILQERVAGSSSWEPVETFSYTNDSGMLKNKALSHDYSVYYYKADAGNSYRAKVYFYAEKGGSDTIEYITSIIKAK